MGQIKVRLERDHQGELQNLLIRLHHHLSLLNEQTDLIDKATNDRAKADKGASVARKEIDQLDENLRDLNSRSKESDDMLSRSSCILSKPVLKLRADLQQDQSCPVCGSTDHPGHDDKATSELLELMRARTSELATEIKETETRRARVHQHLENTSIRMKSAEERLINTREKLEKLETATGDLFAQTDKAGQLLKVKIGRTSDSQKQLSQIVRVEESLEHQITDVQKKLIRVQQFEKEIKTGREQLSRP